MSAKFLSKFTKTFLEVKIDINWVDWTPYAAQSLMKNAPSATLKMGIFLAFIAHANEG